MTDILQQVKAYKCPPNVELDNLLCSVVFELERLMGENQSVKAITWAQAGEIDRLAAENDRLTNNVAALQFRLYLNQLPHDVAEERNEQPA
jgi:hypothetical protein